MIRRVSVMLILFAAVTSCTSDFGEAGEIAVRAGEAYIEEAEPSAEEAEPSAEETDSDSDDEGPGVTDAPPVVTVAEPVVRMQENQGIVESSNWLAHGTMTSEFVELVWSPVEAREMSMGSSTMMFLPGRS